MKEKETYQVVLEGAKLHLTLKQNVMETEAEQLKPTIKTFMLKPKEAYLMGLLNDPSIDLYEKEYAITFFDELYDALAEEVNHQPETTDTLGCYLSAAIKIAERIENGWF